MVASPAMLLRKNPPKHGGSVSYEEYLPYGATAWWAGSADLVSQKRYRFTGMERDGRPQGGAEGPGAEARRHAAGKAARAPQPAPGARPQRPGVREESGLQCHGVRYYAGWLGRWTSADPIGLGDGVNRFGYCHGGPGQYRDHSGLNSTDESIDATRQAVGQLLQDHADGTSPLGRMALGVARNLIYGLPAPERPAWFGRLAEATPYLNQRDNELPTEVE